MGISSFSKKNFAIADNTNANADTRRVIHSSEEEDYSILCLPPSLFHNLFGTRCLYLNIVPDPDLRYLSKTKASSIVGMLMRSAISMAGISKCAEHRPYYVSSRHAWSQHILVPPCFRECRRNATWMIILVHANWPANRSQEVSRKRSTSARCDETTVDNLLRRLVGRATGR